MSSASAAGTTIAVVAGTGTEVGKTWVGALLLQRLRSAGYRVAARKPAQSHEPGDPDTDAALLARASGEDPGSVCPARYDFDRSMAPPMAAASLGLAAFTMAELMSELSWPLHDSDGFRVVTSIDALVDIVVQSIAAARDRIEGFLSCEFVVLN